LLLLLLLLLLARAWNIGIQNAFVKPLPKPRLIRIWGKAVGDDDQDSGLAFLERGVMVASVQLGSRAVESCQTCDLLRRGKVDVVKDDQVLSLVGVESSRVTVGNQIVGDDLAKWFGGIGS
jgi:hypothetical protein